MKRIVSIIVVCLLAVTARANWRGAFDDNYFAPVTAAAGGITATGGNKYETNGYKTDKED